MQVAIANSSTLVTDEQAAAMANAIHTQARRDVWPAWGIREPAVAFFPGGAHPPAGWFPITLVDTIPDVPDGVLGYHTEDPGGSQWGIVAAKPELDNGAAVLTGDWSVSSVLSHEVLELLGDQACNLWAADAGGALWSRELCDPVEAPTYPVAGVSVSNFVLPAWFDPNAARGAKVDQLGVLKAPFTIAKGGYAVYMVGGREQQKFGAEFPAWRRQMKQAVTSRTARRGRQAANILNPF